MGRITSADEDTVVRQPAVVGNQPTSSQDHAQEILQNELVNLAAKVFDASRPVDEYQSVTGATTLEVLPEYEMDELIESIVVVANPNAAATAGPGGTPTTSTGTTGANPAALTIATSQTLPPGTYTVSWSVQLGGTAVAGDVNNFGLYLGASQKAVSVNAQDNLLHTQTPVVIVIPPSALGVISIKNINQPGGVSDTYTGNLSIVLNGNAATNSSITTVGVTGTNPAANTIITQQNLAPGTYTVAWTAQPGGTTSASDANNFGLYLGATLLASSLNGTTTGTPYPQPTVVVVVPTGGATISVQNIAQPGGTSTYTAQLTVTQLIASNVVTLQIGRRLWQLSMGQSGIIQLDGLSLRLNRNERRILTQTVSGPLSLELTGHADMSGT